MAEVTPLRLICDEGSARLAGFIMPYAVMNLTKRTGYLLAEPDHNSTFIDSVAEGIYEAQRNMIPWSITEYDAIVLPLEFLTNDDVCYSVEHTDDSVL